LARRRGECERECERECACVSLRPARVLAFPSVACLSSLLSLAPPGTDRALACLTRLPLDRGRSVPYRRKHFKGDENPVIELARGVLGFAKGLGAFVLISGVASVCYALAAGPKRTSPPPVRTTTGLPYQPGDKPTGQ